MRSALKRQHHLAKQMGHASHMPAGRHGGKGKMIIFLIIIALLGIAAWWFFFRKG